MTSITVAPAVKQDLEALKPGSLTWNEYLRLVLESIDPDRFREALENFHEAELEDAIARARERYAKARADPSRLLTADEARRRVRSRRRDA